MANSFIENIIAKDEELLIFLNNLGNEFWDGFWMFMTNKYTSVPLYLLLIVLFSKRFGLKRGFMLLLFGVLLITASDQLANIFKFGFKRLRPCHEEGVSDAIRLVKSYCGGKYSYFSAHASTGTALAVFFSLAFQSINKNVKYFLLVFAVFVGYSRIYIGVHYPLDVLTGFLIGVGLGFLFFTFSKLLSNKIIKT